MRSEHRTYRPRYGTRVRHSARRAAFEVVVTVVTSVVLAGLLNAQGISRTAQAQPPGTTSDVWRGAASAISAISRTIGFDRPRRAIDAALHPQSAASTTERRPGRGTPARTATASDPLRILLVGDSLMENAARGVLRRLGGVKQVTVEVVAIPGTAINWPFRYDWPEQLQRAVDGQRPDVVGAMFGGHDWRPRKVRGKVLAPPDPAWRADYERRVDELARIAGEGGARVYWLGVPDVQPAQFERAVPELNGVFRSMETRWPAFTYIDTRAALAGGEGGFSKYLRRPDGQLVLTRQPDGVHFEEYGQDLLADLLVAAIAEDFPGVPR